MLLCGGPKGGSNSLRSICVKTGAGLHANYRRISKGGIPPKRETADCTSKLPEWICQKVVKSHLDMYMIGTELKGEMLRFLYLTTSISSTILSYNRTILRQHLEKSDTR